MLQERHCLFCRENRPVVDWRDGEFLRRFMSPQGKILRPRRTGTCAKHQRMVARAIKRARVLGIVPFTTR
ncbi:30S ribosomal protein S18 [Candidatus Azambacteria bacterium]|nr:30S ribosomal protein S18 [Candidatus Azambacteria bacterium]MBI2587891.1 30S ribosomal protein S18 [Candidatus Azambacteria bacterium]